MGHRITSLSSMSRPYLRIGWTSNMCNINIAYCRSAFQGNACFMEHVPFISNYPALEILSARVSLL